MRESGSARLHAIYWILPSIEYACGYMTQISFCPHASNSSVSLSVVICTVLHIQNSYHAANVQASFSLELIVVSVNSFCLLRFY